MECGRVWLRSSPLLCLLWTQSFSIVMAGSRIGFDFNLEDLKAEQIDIDKLVDRLLNSNNGSSSSTVPLSPGNSTKQKKYSEIVNTPAPEPVRSRGPGRPRVTRTSVSQQPKSPAPMLLQDSPLSSIIDCLNRINAQNKKLLGIVENVVEKVNNVNVSGSNKDLSNGVSDPVGVPAASGNMNNVNSRLDKLEQNANQNILICQGSTIESLIKESEVDGKPSPERLKGELCKNVCGESATNINISEIRVSVFGRAKKAIKVDCPNLTSKVQIIKKARERKPQGLYVNEFLTETKLKLFLNARALKKLHPNKLNAVFTRGGNVFYSLVSSERYHQINSITELRDAMGLGASSETEGSR